MLPPAALRPSLHLVGRWMFSPRTDWQGRRRRMALATKATLPAPVRVAQTSVGGVPAERLSPHVGTEAGVLLFLHGGGYCTGSPEGYRALAGRLAHALHCAAVVPRYRLAPEHRWPAPLEDARAAYEGLLEDGTPPEDIVVAGDSAGAHLSLALAMALRDEDRPLPAALGLITPWLDLRPQTLDARPDSPREPFLTRGLMRAFTAEALGDADPEDPQLSPVLADLRGLPPIVVHSGADDHLAPDSEAFAARAREQGVEVEHRRYEGVWHDFHMHDLLMRGVDGTGDLAAALSRHLERSQAAAAQSAATG